MTLIKDIFVSSSIYNNLPHISDVHEAPDEHADDLKDLRALLRRYDVPDGVSVRLIHKHYDTEDGEIMVFKQVPVPSQGEVISMGPLLPSNYPNLKGINFFVDTDGTFQAYEYTTCDVPGHDMSDYQAFLAEFSRIVVERGLQRIFGLKFDIKDEELGWTEFEFPAKRSTILIPKGMPVPEAAEYMINVVTEWGKDDDDLRKRGCPCFNTTCSHCNHEGPNGCGHETQGWEFTLGGQKIDAGSPVLPIMNAVAAVW
ncbi:hypothetical protein FB567DRAFT_100609 [Paraphoma chrysanthemicola]|uniref:Uncharacterized protein n=1 Tax=Paraphoma chrysanthemicola TaxID=798071 RepID=A0A8K0VW58_9PLEO|nr:hypothetical protein FB567DRAFT_100609 [Paraphoma chrysanthemicola]